MKKLNTRNLRAFKASKENRSLQMLTCYDFQTAQMLNDTALDLILVGDSVGNVILGYETTVSVSVEEMILFGSAVKRGAPDKFTVVDMPFGSYATMEDAIKNATQIMQRTNAEAIKLEGAFDFQLEIIKRLTEIGIPVMGHIGLTPQSVHQQGGYYKHGKSSESAKRLIQEATKLEEAGVFSLVLECVDEQIATELTSCVQVPTIGIGSGKSTDGQVLVINDLFHLGKKQPPSFCKPIANLHEYKKELIATYLNESNANFIQAH
jgi:3-methyl-2-oxobutanoate hydroxymethyltransferase